MNKLYTWALKLQDNVSSGMAKISGSTDHASDRFSKLQNNLSRTQGSFSKLKNIAIGSLAAFSMVEFGKQALHAYDQQEQANAQLQAGLISTGGVVGRTFKAMDAQASALEKITRFEDDAIMGAQSLMLTFTNVRKEIFDKSIPAVLDLASKMGIDASSAAMQLGKALNDPLNGMNALSRSGITFSDAQKEMIENFVKTNQLAKAQELILGELHTQVGGTAKALGNAGMGPIIRMQHGFNNIMEKLGGSLSKVYNVKPMCTGLVI